MARVNFTLSSSKETISKMTSIPITEIVIKKMERKLQKGKLIKLKIWTRLSDPLEGKLTILIPVRKGNEIIFPSRTK